MGCAGEREGEGERGGGDAKGGGKGENASRGEQLLEFRSTKQASRP